MNYGLNQQVVDSIIDLSKEFQLSKTILFGSRARGDYAQRSDIDLAIMGGNTMEFQLSIDESIHTLLSFDVVVLDKPLQQQLRESIEQEGIILYEKN
ncbi:MAG: nucleotidyltransferase domain-containing protein [Eubacteriales bacterium]